jgi:hypothetical protein
VTTDSWIALVVIVLCVVILIADRVAPVVVLGGAVVVLMFLDVIDSEVALSGLSSPAPATIAALYVLAGAVTATGTFSRVFDRLLDRKGSIALLAAVTAGASSVVPNPSCAVGRVGGGGSVRLGGRGLVAGFGACRVSGGVASGSPGSVVFGGFGWTAGCGVSRAVGAGGCVRMRR